jgi:hypothetical protein
MIYTSTQLRATKVIEIFLKKPLNSGPSGHVQTETVCNPEYTEKQFLHLISNDNFLSNKFYVPQFEFLS